MKRLGVALASAILLLAGSLSIAPNSAEAAAAGKKKNKPNSPAASSAPRTGVEKKDTGPVVSGDTVEKNVEKLTEKLHWFTSLDEAKQVAAKEHKPIYWLHVLGDIDGECWSAAQSLRAVSLSNDNVMRALRSQFVIGYRNITGEPWAGRSGHHDPDAPAVLTTNGAGPHNVQHFFLNADGTVLHCLPGFWAPQDLLREMQFAIDMNKLWSNKSVSADAKKRQFGLANVAHMRTHPADMTERSHLQNFDAKREKQTGESDFKLKPGDIHHTMKLAKNNDLKTTDQVLHERMAQQPFVKYEDFNVAEFSDYGKQRYDKKEETRLADATGAKPAAKRKK